MYLHFFINEGMEEFEFEEAVANLDDMVSEFQQCGPNKKDAKDTSPFSVLDDCGGAKFTQLLIRGFRVCVTTVIDKNRDVQCFEAGK